jgi:hypothetical protein
MGMMRNAYKILVRIAERTRVFEKPKWKDAIKT